MNLVKIKKLLTELTSLDGVQPHHKLHARFLEITKILVREGVLTTQEYLNDGHLHAEEIADWYEENF